MKHKQVRKDIMVDRGEEYSPEDIIELLYQAKFWQCSGQSHKSVSSGWKLEGLKKGVHTKQNRTQGRELFVKVKTD